MARKLAPALAVAALCAAFLAPNVAAAALDASVAVKRAPHPAGPATASLGACAANVPTDAPAAAQEEAMLCLTNEARERFGLPALAPNGALDASAGEKAGDVLRCDEFSHLACGRELSYWMGQSGYLAAECWRVGENLAWGTGSFASVGSIFRAWMRSESHRENLLGDYDEIGIELRVGSLGNLTGTHVWSQHFGTHRCRG